jgi:o-succinylbenzoate---CoA ligase
MTSVPETLSDWLAEAARAVPRSVALTAGDRSLTYEELDDVVAVTAGLLASHGVREGDRVATLLPNGLEAAVLPHAVLRLGAVLVPLNVRLAPPEVEWQLRHARPGLVVTHADTQQLVPPEMGPLAMKLDAIAANSRGDVGRVRGDERTIAAGQPLAVIYTSGTTGRPRGATLTVGNFWWSAKASALNLGVRDNDRWLAVLPLFHVGGLSIVLRSAINATAALIHQRFDAAAVNAAIDRDGVTMVSLVSILLQRLLDDRGDRPFPATFRCALVGGGPVPLPLLQRCERAGAPVVQTYGLTEAASQVATLSPTEAPRKQGSAGRPLAGIQVRIECDGEGEILVRGPVVMAGYLDDPAATAAALRDGWLHTGDIGRMDGDGYLYVLDRRDDLIVSGGENVYPAEVEAVLQQHPAVEEAAAVAAPDDTWGQRVVAVVRWHAGADGDLSELRAFCRERLAGYKVPWEFRVVAGPLPRTTSGKLQRSLIRQLV